MVDSDTATTRKKMEKKIEKNEEGVQLRIIDNITVFPNLDVPGHNIISIYFRDEKGHKWLLYGEKVKREISLAEVVDNYPYIDKSRSNTYSHFELAMDITPGQTRDKVVLELIDLQPDHTLHELYDKLVSLVGEYKDRLA